MQILVERHAITRTNGLSRHFAEADRLCFAGKNLYNTGRYLRNQFYRVTGQNLSYADTEKNLRARREYRELPAKVAQLVRRQLLEDEKNHFAAITAWQASPEKFNRKPNFPGYKEKNGRTTLEFNAQAVSKKALKHGVVRLGGTAIEVNTKVPPEKFRSARLVPRTSCYVLEVLYEVPDVAPDPNAKHVLALDLGVENTVSAVFLKESGAETRVAATFILCGRRLKSINQYFNKIIAAHKSALAGHRTLDIVHLDEQGQATYGLVPLRTSRRIGRAWLKRQNQMNAILHRMSHTLIRFATSRGIGRLVVGYNPGWKNESPMGDASNQNFVQIPFRALIDQLRYKGAQHGVEVIETGESYTSKASALDGDDVPDYTPGMVGKPVFSGRRQKRGLYKTAAGHLVNADINGALNIYRKYKGKLKEQVQFCSESLVGLCSSPVRVEISLDKPDQWKIMPAA